MHLWSGLESDRKIENNINAYKLLREISDKHSLMLTVENVVCNNYDPMHQLDNDGTINFEALNRSFDVIREYIK